MTPGPGIEPGTHWWKASALTTAPTLIPNNNVRSPNNNVTQPHSAYSSERELYDGQLLKFLFRILTLSYVFCLGYFSDSIDNLNESKFSRDP